MGFVLNGKKNKNRERVIYNGNVTGDKVIDLFNKISFYINEVNEMNKNDFINQRRDYLDGMEYDYYNLLYSNGVYESNDFIDYRFGYVYTVSEIDDRVDYDGNKGRFVLNTKTIDCYSEEFKDIYNIYKTFSKSEAFRLIDLLKNNFINGNFIVNNEVVNKEISLYEMIDPRIFNFHEYYTEMTNEDIIELINNLNCISVVSKVEGNVYELVEYDGYVESLINGFNGFFELVLNRGLISDNDINFIMINNKRMIDFIRTTLMYNSLESYLEFVNSDYNEYRKAVHEIICINYFKNNDFTRYNFLLSDFQKEIFEYVFQFGLNKLNSSIKEGVKESEYVKRF